MGRVLTPDEVLVRIPQQEPFRFVDAIVEVSPERVVGRYRWRPEADFYRGHFPGSPVTPGVLLIESMAQCGVVPLAIYRTHLEMDDADAEKFQTLFTDTQIDFHGVVPPGETVHTEAKLVFFRRRKMRVDATMTREDGTVVCSGQLAGIGVRR